jgi:hypothetical protein
MDMRRALHIAVDPRRYGRRDIDEAIYILLDYAQAHPKSLTGRSRRLGAKLLIEWQEKLDGIEADQQQNKK